jgi:hypothetical protein
MTTSHKTHLWFIWFHGNVCQITIHVLGMMQFQRNMVFITLHGSPQWNGDLHLRSIHETEDDLFNVKSDNTALVAVLFSIKHNFSARNARAITKPHGGSSNSGRAFNQLTFYNSDIRYDRIFMFGDLILNRLDISIFCLSSLITFHSVVFLHWSACWVTRFVHFLIKINTH